ncbi:MAG: nitroreductase family protein, partial [Proteobacteria bacterium]|nr:nitroreductase family protein [Pseudomonadota bacterium]
RHPTFPQFGQHRMTQLSCIHSCCSFHECKYNTFLKSCQDNYETVNKTKKEELATAAGGQAVVRDAPVVIVCCGLVEAFSRKMQRQSLKQLMEVGALNWTDDILDNVVLESDLFAPYRLGEQVMTIKAGEQIMIAIAYMTLEAVNLGLGTCWVGAMSAKDIHKVMNLPNILFVHDLIPLGYPDEEPDPRPRKPLDQISFWERYE